MGLVQEKGYCILESKQLPAVHGIDLLPVPLNKEALSVRKMIRESLFTLEGQREIFLKKRIKTELGKEQRLSKELVVLPFLFFLLLDDFILAFVASSRLYCVPPPTSFPPTLLLLYHLLHPNPQLLGFTPLFFNDSEVSIVPRIRKHSLSPPFGPLPAFIKGIKRVLVVSNLEIVFFHLCKHSSLSISSQKREKSRKVKRLTRRGM